MTRIETFKAVRKECIDQTSPGMEAVFKPILEQLDYLIAFELNETIDRSLVQNVDIGLRALRNLDDVLPELTKRLYEVQRMADRMAEENGMKNRLAV